MEAYELQNTLTDAVDVVDRDRQVSAAFAKVPYYPLVVKRGYGAIIEDIEGRKYIDLLASAAAANTGHTHPKVVAAIIEQAKDLVHYTAAYMYLQQPVDLAEALTEITPGQFPKRVAFGLSGSDAIDGAIKLARAYTGRYRLISFVQSYHGSTFGAISLSALSLNMRRKIGPLLPGMHHIQYPDCYRCPYSDNPETCRLQCLDELRIALTHYLPPEEVAAVVMEPIAGDAGLLVPPKRYLQELHAICRKHGILFIVDEVQQGFGRTGKWFGIEHFGVEPDLVVMGKSIASGLPMSAIVGRAEIFEALDSPAHLFTTGGNPVASQAALATISVIKEENLLERSVHLGHYMRSEFAHMAKTYDLIGDVRGLGLSIGVDLVTDHASKARAREAAAKITYRCYELGAIVIFLAGSVLRIQPPLVISKEQVDRGLAIIEQAIKEYQAGLIPDEVLQVVQGW